MATSTAAMPAPADGPRERRAFQLAVAVSVAVFLLMMLVGLVLRATQAAWLGVPPNYFYELMTLHGIGMVGIAGVASATVMWYFLRRYVSLSTPVFYALLALSVAGVVAILGAVLLGRFAAAWTFLFPLPAKSMGLWTAHAAAAYLVGVILVGVGFLLFNADAALAIIRKYGSLGRALGLPYLFGGAIDPALVPTVVASTMVIIVNILGVAVGAVILVLSLVNLYVPQLALDALLAKNLIYFFGHVFINATIYMALIGVYELLPRYTGRPWKVTRPFLWAWAAVTLMVLGVYPHHTLMDFVMPAWALVVGQVLSYLSAVPLLVVTAYGALTNLHRSGVRWDLPLRLLVLGLFGWTAGVIPAVVDGVIRVNLVMHNTLWVPGHFHFYLLLGLVPLLFGAMLYAVREGEGRETAGDRIVFWIYALAGAVFCLAFLWSGWQSVPRRFAEHFAEWQGSARIATIAGVLVVLAALHLGGKLLARLPRVSLGAGAA